MAIDIEKLSEQLLERLANSIHDRDAADNKFCFSIAEKLVTEKWIVETLQEITKKMGEY